MLGVGAPRRLGRSRASSLWRSIGLRATRSQGSDRVCTATQLSLKGSRVQGFLGGGHRV